MENTKIPLFRIVQENDTIDENNQKVEQADIKNLQKAVLQSFKYCQAKKNKNKFIRTKKIQDMKTYQKKLVAIVKRKSEEVIFQLMGFTNSMINEEENACEEVAKTEEETLSNLKQKIVSLTSSQASQPTSQISLRQRMKRLTFECEQQLQRMQNSQQSNKTDTQIDYLINRMEKPFKKLCSYFSMLNKEINELQEESKENSAAVHRKESTETRG